MLRILYRISQCSCVLFIPLVLSSPIFPGLRRSNQLNMADFSAQWKNKILKERIKDNILHSLNITKPPFVTPRTLPVPGKKKLPKGGAVTSDWFRNVSLILSEATDPYKKDFMVFKLHSKVRTQLTHIETPLIILRLKLNSKRSKSSTKGVRSRVYETLCKQKNNSSNNTSIKLNSTEIPEKAYSLPKAKKICAGLSKKKLSKQVQRKLKRMLRSKARKIRIIVRVLDPNTNKRRKIFSTKILLKKLKTLSVPVPKKIFESAAGSEDHSLVVQVNCRNCKRFVKMDRVYRKSSKKQSSNPLRLNPNRPYLYIKTKSGFKNNINSKHRSKRRVSTNLCSKSGKNSFLDGNTHYESDLQCCEKRTYISFEELGLDDIIVYPPGFTTVDCLGECSNSGETIPASHTPQTINFKDNVHASSNIGRHQSCVSTSKSSLDILYFLNSHTIIPKRLVDFIGESCGCSV